MHTDFRALPAGAAVIDMPGVTCMPRRIVAASQAPTITGPGFRAARRELGLSRRGLGRLLGVHRETIRRWEARPAGPRGAAAVLVTLMLWEARGG